MMKRARQRAVATSIPVSDRGCLYCLTPNGPFTRNEHVIPRSLGPETDEYVIEPGGVCDPCNEWLGKQVDAPFAARFDMKLTRGLERLAGRGGIPLEIKGRDPKVLLTVQLGGGKVAIEAERADRMPGGQLDIEIRPLERDPADVVTRTLRALWKIALGVAFLDRGRDALDPRWDHLRCGVLGAPLEKGFVLQRPFTAMVTRELHVHANFATPDLPDAMAFVMGGVALAAPLANHVKLSAAAIRAAGWEVHGIDKPAPKALHFRLEP
jgi:hypothetical protein